MVVPILLGALGKFSVSLAAVFLFNLQRHSFLSSHLKINTQQIEEGLCLFTNKDPSATPCTIT